ncbi:unnamed protein product [Closterium sp. NIES-65]|nr:unnamed protein product [Closterium sp. NIES-65]
MPSLPRRGSHAAAVSSSAVFSPPPIVLPPHPFLPTLIPSLAEHKAHIIPRRGSNSIPLTSSSPLTYRRPRFPRFPVALTPKNNRFATPSLTPSPTCPHGHRRARLPPSSLTLPRSSPPLPPIVGQASPHRRPRFPPSSPTLPPIVAHASPHRRPRSLKRRPRFPPPSPTLSPTIAHPSPNLRPPPPSPALALPSPSLSLAADLPSLPPLSASSSLPCLSRSPSSPSLPLCPFPIASLSPTQDGEVWRAGLGARDGVVTRSLWGVEGCVVSSTHPFLSCTDLLPSLAPTLHAWQVVMRLWSRVLGAQPGQRVQADSKECSAAGGGRPPLPLPSSLPSCLPLVLPSSRPPVLFSFRPAFLPSSLPPVLPPRSPLPSHAFISPSLISPFLISPSLISPFLISPFLISPSLISPSLISPFLISPSLISSSLISPSFISPFRLTPFCPTPFRHAILLLIPIPSFPHPSFPDPIIPSANFPIPPYGHTPSRDLPVTSTRPLSSLLLPIFPSSASPKGLFFTTSAIHPFYTHPLLPIHPIPKSCPYPSSRDPSSRFLIPSSPRPVLPCLPSVVPHLHLFLPSSILVTSLPPFLLPTLLPSLSSSPPFCFSPKRPPCLPSSHHHFLPSFLHSSLLPFLCSSLICQLSFF